MLSKLTRGALGLELFVIALFAVATFGCSSTRAVPGDQPPEDVTWPEVIPQTGNTVPATEGVTSTATTAQDTTSGAAVTVPAGTRIETSDPEFDTDGDGLADSFAPTVGEVSAALTLTSVGSSDGGATFTTVDFVGGISLEPADAQFSTAIIIVIPVSDDAGLAVGDPVTVWRFTDSRTTSQTGGAYWANVGNGVVTIQLGNLVVLFETLRFGNFGITRQTMANGAPAITGITSNIYNVETDTATTLTCSATDPDSDTLSYSWSGGGAFASSGSASTSWQSATAGVFVLICTVSDGQGHIVSASVTVVVTAPVVVPPANQPPVISSVTANPTTVMAGANTTLNCTAVDPDADTLTYSWSGVGSFANSSQAQTTWNHTAAGTHSLQCTVDDGQGNQVSQSVSVTVNAPDTTVPLWTGGDAGLVVNAFEGYVEVFFNEATDLESSPVSYTLYYQDTATFSEGTATQVDLTTYPAGVARIDGLALGTEYTVGITASDSAPLTNTTVLETATATPQPYYGDIPTGGHTFPASAKWFDIDAVAGSDRRVMVVWADPLSGVLSQSYYTDGAWVVREVDSSKNYVLAQAFFNGSLPVVVTADDAGNLDMLTQGTDGLWTSTNLFSRAAVMHVGVDVVFDAGTGMAYIGHATQDTGLPPQQTAHFLAVDMSGATPTVTDQIDDYSTAQFIGQGMVRLDDSGNPVMIFSRGTGSFKFPNSLDMEIVFAAYDSGTGLTAEVVTEFNPLFFDAKAKVGGGWDLVVTDGEWFVMGNNDFIYFTLRTSSGSGATWSTTDIFTQTLDIVGDVISYDAPLECVWSTTPGTVFFNMGTGDIDLTLLMSAPTLALWSATPPDPPVAEAGNPLSRLNSFSTGTSGFLLGAEVPEFDFEDLGNQHDFPGGILVLREIP